MDENDNAKSCAATRGPWKNHPGRRDSLRQSKENLHVDRVRARREDILLRDVIVLLIIVVGGKLIDDGSKWRRAELKDDFLHILDPQI